MDTVDFQVNTIYSAIEGEGVHIGRPTIFLRLQGCSVKCKWCDSKETWNPTLGQKYKLEDLVHEVSKESMSSGVMRISITGGSPLQQDNLDKLVQWLKNGDLEVNIETSGQEFDKSTLDLVDTISCDFKPKSSGVTQNEYLLEEYVSEYAHKLQIKAVVSCKEDLADYMRFINSELIRHYEFKNYVVTPAWEKEKLLDKELIKYIQDEISKSGLPIRMICQQHKFLWGTSKTDC
jgi:organic radical activating enzyme